MPKQVLDQELVEADKSFRESFSARLGSLIDENGGQAAVHRKTGIPISTLAKWTKADDPNLPRAMQLRMFCRGLKLDANDLLSLETDYVAVPMRKVARRREPELVNSGRGTKELYFRRAWLEEDEREVANIFGFKIDPAIATDPVRPGDIVLVDADDDRPQTGALFLVFSGTSIGIRRIDSSDEGDYEVRIHPDQEGKAIKPADLKGRLQIQGKIIWRGGEV